MAFSAQTVRSECKMVLLEFEKQCPDAELLEAVVQG